ncbi:hypothetical protein TWF696_001556 [Orbilia brochopaga]|uniref:tRNA wybutosine-synthesizing protein 2 n=1 Tax=Orbilia brochopaga TaxID=3140254 RepID=A0AAV9U9S7_9PEZI
MTLQSPANISTTSSTSMQDATNGPNDATTPQIALQPSNASTRPPRPRKQHVHPYIPALTAFLSSHAAPSTSINPTVPLKLRYDIYGPLLLLPPTSPLVHPPWSDYLASLPAATRGYFYGVLAAAFAVTHIAINAPITTDPAVGGNTIRAPRITALHGDFGLCEPDAEDDESPGEAAFDRAFWARVVQHGVYQTWAPVHTMFSRGNISEKERIHNLVASQMRMRDEGGRTVAAVDLFVGIGYFAFSYLKAGIPVVFGWDINPWSIEGCRRGAIANKWPVAVATTQKDVVLGGANSPRLCIYQESNVHAPARLAAVKERMLAAGKEWVYILHINLGLLPTSAQAYEIAVAVLALNDTTEETWVHVHENVAKEDVESLKDAVVGKFAALVANAGMERDVSCTHVEYVKSWAPGVWHCVFDIRIAPVGG